MKKVFLFLAVSALTFSSTSCTKKEDSATSGSMGKLTFTMDGASKTFSNVMASNTPGVGLTVMAFNGTQAAMTDQVTFVVNPDKTGTSAMADQGFMYMAGQEMYSDGSDFVLTVSTNSTSAKTLKGTFAGTLENDGDGANKKVTNGSFDIKYQ